MQKWEYDVMFLPANDPVSLTEGLNEAGEEGWEIFSVRPHPTETFNIIVIFKRPKADAPSDPMFAHA
jgi:hypothetical protein